MKIDCEFCGKTHRTFSGADDCRNKALRAKCSCPDYYRKRWTSHVVGCALRPH